MQGRKILLAIISATLASGSLAEPGFSYQISPIPPQIQAVMQHYTWHPGCPVPLTDLAYLSLSYWGYDRHQHQGALIVNKKLAKEVVAIFRDLYAQKFPIERMQLMDDFKGNDDAAMAVNNTSAFNCRAITGKPGTFSLHSYGMAVDVNTLVNPYVKGNYVAPPAGRAYLDRTRAARGMIVERDGVYWAFISRGWKWGGDWASPEDYQHFEKK